MPCVARLSPVSVARALRLPAARRVDLMRQQATEPVGWGLC